MNFLERRAEEKKRTESTNVMIESEEVERMMQSLTTHMKWALETVRKETVIQDVDLLMTAERARVAIKALEDLKSHLQEPWN